MALKLYFQFTWDPVFSGYLPPYLHGHKRGEVAGVVSEQQGTPVALAGRALQREVDPAKRDGGKSLAVYVLKPVFNLDDTSN